MADNSYTKRFTTDNTGNLSANLPRPNIIRIEVLDGAARARYLKTYGGGDNIFSATNIIRQESLGDMFNGRKEERVFYGFLSPEADTSFNMGATWDRSQLGGNVFGVIKKVADNAGPPGALLNKTIQIGQGIQEVGNLIGQMNSTATGAATMQEFTGVSLSDFTAKCVWYMPEQEDIATHSLQILYRMLYPRQVTTDRASKIVGDGAAWATTATLNAGKDVVADTEFADKINQLLPSVAEGIKDGANATVKFTGDVVGVVASTAYSVTNKIGNLFGTNTTINPLPVRVCIGHHIDVEPLVITGISTTFSRETFISEKIGRHLPLFATANITFKYWVNPAPNLEFANILGIELFGDKAIGE